MGNEFIRAHGMVDARHLRNVALQQPAQAAPAPPVEPTPPPVAPTTGLPTIALIEEYQLTTAAGDIGVSRTIGSVLTVPPLSKRTVWLRKKTTSSSNSGVSTSVLESQERSVAQDLSNSVRNSDEQTGSSAHSDWKFDASFHGEASVGFMSGSADADVHATGASNEVRDAYRNAVDSAVEEQVSKTESSRNQTATTSQTQITATDETESIETFELNNLDGNEVLNMALCQLSVERLTALSLVNVKLGFFDPVTKKFEVAPLSGMTTLLGKVIPDPANREKARSAIVAMLENVFDYQDEPRKLIEKRPLEGGTGERAFIHRVIPNLRTQVEIPRTDGTMRKFTVPGIAIKAMYRVTAIPQFGMVRATAVD